MHRFQPVATLTVGAAVATLTVGGCERARSAKRRCALEANAAASAGGERQCSKHARILVINHVFTQRLGISLLVFADRDRIELRRRLMSVLADSWNVIQCKDSHDHRGMQGPASAAGFNTRRRCARCPVPPATP